MNIIAIESATTICGVALFMDNEIKDIDEVNQSQVHSQRLPIIVESMLKNHLININELDGIAISSGPGSYTGLRIGMSFAKGLAISGNINIIPVPTILAINYSIQQKGKYWIILHSHKDYVYSQYYDYQVYNKVHYLHYQQNLQHHLNNQFQMVNQVDLYLYKHHHIVHYFLYM